MCIGEKEYWGKGFAKETRILVLKYAFLELGLKKVYTYNWEKNDKIIGLNKKLGFKIEGTLRQHAFFKGEYRDYVIMGILQEEWEKVEK